MRPVWLRRSPLLNPVYRRLFAAQVFALAGTGILTIALALLAFDLDPSSAARVLGAVLALKMMTYVTVSLAAPWVIARALPKVSAQRIMVVLDGVRVLIALALPFVTDPWQVFGLIAALSACSASFKPLFQATLPAILHDEEHYTRALSLTRLAYDLENVLSPAIAAALLVWMDARFLFGFTAVGFLLSAGLIQSIDLRALPAAPRHAPLRGAWRAFSRTPRLRGVLVLNLAVASAGAMMIVKGVEYVRGHLGMDESAVAVAMLATGAGSMLMALLLPSLLKKFTDRPIMLLSAGVAGATLLVGCLSPSFSLLLALWFVLGAAIAAIQTPIGRLLNRSVHAEGRPAVFALQFSLSHGCWLVAYGLAGWLPGGAAGTTTFAVLGGVTLLSALLAARVWRGDVAEFAHELAHEHALPHDHPHVLEGQTPAGEHAHPFVIDDLHQRWPRLELQPEPETSLN
jgi:predicted MFS family arabinose efflux permease